MLSTRTKLLYGVGFSARGIKDGLFQIFLFFYFNQVLGLDPAFAGSASLIALLFDAVTDPIVGLWSDRFRSERWGRRHPFMVWSAVPLGIFTYLLFLPPSGLGQIGLFIWLTTFSVLVRAALTFFVVPHISLGAELTEDYNERTSVTAYRIMFAALIAPIVMIIGFTQFFKGIDGDNGMFNAAAYPKFALFCAVLMIISILIMVWGTRHVIPSLPQVAKGNDRPSFMQMLRGFGVAVRMKSFVTLVGYIMMVYVGLGIGIILTTYFMTYFFELTESEMALLPIASAVGALVAFALAPRMSKRYDKKKSAIISTILFGLFFSAPFILRLLGLFPENHTAALLPTYVLMITVAYGFLWVAMSLGASMMADIVDEYEVKSGLRQEGLFFSVMSFSHKMTTGVGTFLAGLILSIIAFPVQSDVSAVPAEIIRDLGIVGGPILLAIYWASLLFLFNYPLTKETYQKMRSQLDEVS